MGIQIPIIDIRPLVKAETFQHPYPTFPHPERIHSRRSALHYRTNFLAQVGPVRPRLKGNSIPWAGEEYYINAKTAVILDGDKSNIGQDRVTVLYRNYLTDGIVGRLEIAFRTKAKVPRNRRRPVELRILGRRGHVRGGFNVPLEELGPVFAQHLLRATTVSQHTEHAESGWLRSGPVAVMTQAESYKETQSYAPAESTTDESILSFEWARANSSRVLFWSLDQWKERSDELRRLRLHLSRLHADYAAFSLVIRMCQSGALDETHPPVERYIIRSARVLHRQSRHGFLQSALLTRVLESADDAYGDVQSGFDYLADSSNKVLARRIAAMRQSVPVHNQHSLPAVTTINVQDMVVFNMTGPQHNTNINAGAIGAVSSGSGDAYGQASGTLGADPQALMVALIEACQGVKQHLSPGEAATVEDTVGGLQRELERPADQRDRETMLQRVKRLLSIAASAGNAGTSLAHAAEALRQALGF